MIENYIKEILNIKNINIQGEILNNLADDFRAQVRDPRDLIKLLENDNDEMIDIGLYLFREIVIEDSFLLNDFIKIFENLIKHENKEIRFWAFISYSETLTEIGNFKKLNELYLQMVNDRVKSIRDAGINLIKDGHLR